MARIVRMSLLAVAFLATAGCASLSGAGPQRSSNWQPTERHLMVVLPEADTKASERMVRELTWLYSLQVDANWRMRSLGAHCVVFWVPEGQLVEDVSRRLAEDPRVELVQPVQTFSSLAYNDPYSDLQHGARTVRAAMAHRWATGRGVRVAVVDTGVDYQHPDLEGRVVERGNFVTHDQGRFTSDIHGTAVAGVIAAAADNNEGIVGIAPEAQILALKACWQREPDSAEALCNSYSLALALDFAIGAGVQALNFSLAGPTDPLLARLINEAYDRGIVVVAAGGKAERLEAHFPASLEMVIGVHSVTSAPAEAAGAVHPPPIAAPGVDVLTTVPQGGYDFLSGSSLAAAHVSGIAALLLERDPTLTPKEIRSVLEMSRGSILEEDGRTLCGECVVDACLALAHLLGNADACSSLEPEAEHSRRLASSKP